jgi:hypothetical protein
MAETTLPDGRVTWMKHKYSCLKPKGKGNRGKSGGASTPKKPAKGKK